ncbi:hypothetical protein ANO14919_052330 [Xylariales sp. No.14919]|nr:hypothetical protein ANO14919_052330 [Xylariales sp. No.14919]
MQQSPPPPETKTGEWMWHRMLAGGFFDGDRDEIESWIRED